MKNRDKKDKLKHKSLGEKIITIKDNYKQMRKYILFFFSINSDAFMRRTKSK